MANMLQMERGDPETNPQEPGFIVSYSNPRWIRTSIADETGNSSEHKFCIVTLMHPNGDEFKEIMLEPTDPQMNQNSVCDEGTLRTLEKDFLLRRCILEVESPDDGGSRTLMMWWIDRPIPDVGA